jgi:hypothetical protein
MKKTEGKEFIEQKKWFLSRFPDITGIWRKQNKDKHFYTTVKLRNGKVATVKSPKDSDNMELGILWAYTKATEQKLNTRTSIAFGGRTSGKYQNLIRKYMEEAYIKIPESSKKLLEELREYSWGVDVCNREYSPYDTGGVFVTPPANHASCPASVTQEQRNVFDLAKAKPTPMQHIFIDGEKHKVNDFNIEIPPPPKSAKATFEIEASSYGKLFEFSKAIQKTIDNFKP